MSVLDRTPPTADHRIHYGAGELQFGDLWIPAGAIHGTLPLVVFIHGGWWRSEFDLAYGGHLCAALKADGFPVWSIEYRRVGYTGGGWPTTFQDVAAGFDYIATLAKSYPIDLQRVVATGHSAGGHLAFWLAGRHHVPHDSPLAQPPPRVMPRAVIGLAAAADLRLTADLAGYFTFAHDKQEVYRLIGGSPDQVPDRYKAGNPGDLLPFNIPQTLIQGSEDGQIPPTLPGRWAEQARRQGDPVTVTIVQGADHFDVVDPLSEAWSFVRNAVKMACGS
ncbi:alpha/beta hydrolase [Granulicella sibirica]|uniref:Putative lipase/esterase n=1 Tax=Granulicella sibirica TaxID=2479048 RepID=A0A4Q0T0T3_9BACT|nr:alpha/beta hydrolase [Granulicella sibirica]RXH55558.1 putative lipase/esterase [Granulicella sibirica]